MENKVYFMMGQRGSGKNTQMSILLSDYGDYFTQALSVKSRELRMNDGEIDGVSFIQKPVDYFLDSANENVFIEKNEHYGAWYGTRSLEIFTALSSGKHVLKELEPQGLEKAIHKGMHFPFMGIFLQLPYDQIAPRMLKRDPHTKQEDIALALERDKYEREKFIQLQYTYGGDLLRIVDASIPIPQVTAELLNIMGIMPF